MIDAPWGVRCRSCGLAFREAAIWEKCRACRSAVDALDPEEAAGVTFADADHSRRVTLPPVAGGVLAEVAAACGFDVAQQVDHVARSLERAITAWPNGSASYMSWRIDQRCPICRIGLATTFRAEQLTGIDGLFREMFELFDEHRCHVTSANAGELRARAERASERLAERAGVLRARERTGPPLGPSLYERAERESVVFAEWALRFAGP